MATAQTQKPAPTNAPAKKPRAPPTYKGSASRILRSLDRAARGAETLQRSSKVVGTHAQTDAFQKAVRARLERIENALTPYVKGSKASVSSEIPDA